jgi:glycosyltransferase involved in cell wall biosynthesis
MEQKTIIIVVPCYNEQEVLADSNKKLLDLLEQMISDNLISNNSKILYVNDGSKDKTWDLISEYCKEYKYVCGLKLAKNAGHQNALLSGLTIGKDWGDALISIDADLQDDIHVIPDMVRKFNNGKDIVYGIRKKRNTDSWFKRNTALAFYKLMHYLGVKSVYNHADFRLMSKRAVEQLCKYRERNLFLRGMVPLIGYETDCVYYDRSERLAGESKYPIGKMVNFAIDGITSFSTKPVRMVFGLGIVFLVISLVILIYVVIAFINHQAVPGWASIILSIWFVGACILMGLGIVGEYIGKIYIEVKDRPRYNIEDIKK